MTSAPELINLLCLDAHRSKSPFGGKHRTILIAKDFSNVGDFVFNSLLNNFVRKEPKTPVLLITISHDWSNYSACAAKCGYNMRRAQNGGNMTVLNVMQKYMKNLGDDNVNFDFCDYVYKSVEEFLLSTGTIPMGLDYLDGIIPVAVMIDDLSLLRTLGAQPKEIYHLFHKIDRKLRERSVEVIDGKLSHFIVQTMSPSIDQKKQKTSFNVLNSNYSFATSNMENSSDLYITLRPLKTGYSPRVDGTINIVDNRLPTTDDKQEAAGKTGPTSLFPTDSLGEVGTNKAYFFKLGDRRARLTSNAVVF